MPAARVVQLEVYASGGDAQLLLIVLPRGSNCAARPGLAVSRVTLTCVVVPLLRLPAALLVLV